MALVINTINRSGGGGTTITVVANYSALPDPTTVSGKFYWCENSQGTSWLPSSLGGTYYSAGQYYSNGTNWTFIDVPYQATLTEVNTGTNTDKFVTPSTLSNSNWAFTSAKVLTTLLSGLSTASSAKVTATNTILEAIGLLQGQATLNETNIYNFLRDKTGIKRAFEVVPNGTYEPTGWATSDFTSQGNYSKSGEAGVGFKTSATAGNIAFKRRAATLNMKGNTGIFWEKIKFDSAVTDARFVHCVTPDFFFVAPTNVSPTSLLNVVGICKLSTSQNIHVFHNDASGVATTIDLGASFPANNVGGDKLYLIGLESKISSYVVHVHQLDLSTWELNGTSVITEVSTDIPNKLTTDLRLTTFITNNTTASIASYVDYHILANNIK